ncbi:MAG: winged helix-turn-helix transcriptional regulator, partial [Nitrososphaerota archaeon]
MSEDKEMEEAIWLLRHRVRRRIIMTIGDEGRISATTLRDKLGISTGSLYYNLKQLEKLVTQDSKRNYVLTEEGVAIYRLLKEQGDINLESIKAPQSKFEVILSNIFFPVW